MDKDALMKIVQIIIRLSLMWLIHTGVYAAEQQMPEVVKITAEERLVNPSKAFTNNKNKPMEYWREQHQQLEQQVVQSGFAGEDANVIYKALVREIRNRQQRMIEQVAMASWLHLEKERHEIKELIAIRYGIEPLLTTDFHNDIHGYTDVAMTMVKSDIRLLNNGYTFHRQWLDRWWQKNLSHISISLVPIIVTSIILLVYTLLFFLWIRKTSNGAREKSLMIAASPVMNVAWVLVGVLRWPLGLLVFSNSAFNLLYAHFVLPEFYYVNIVCSTMLLAYLVNALVAYKIDQIVDSNAIQSKYRNKLKNIVREVLIIIALIRITRIVMEQWVGGGTLALWVEQAIHIYLQLFLLMQLYSCYGILYESVVKVVPKRTRKKARFIDLPWVLRPVSSLVLMYMLIYQGVRALIYRHSNARKFFAYLSKKEMQRVELKDANMKTKSLDASVLESFTPECEYKEYIDYASDVVEKLDGYHKENNRFFLAIVAPRGMGKTTLIKRTLERNVHCKYMQCPAEESEIYAELAKLLGVKEYSAVEQLLAVIKKYPKTVIYIDDCQRLMVPAIGGLVLFEAVIELLQKAGGEVSWVMAFEMPAWNFFRRARFERVIFDDVLALPAWNEKQIYALIEQRTKLANIIPDFSNLFVGDNADQEDGFEADQEIKEEREEIRQQLIKHKAQSKAYIRVLWDYAGGNPLIALWAWQNSLYQKEDEDTVYVGLFKNLDTQELDELPNLMIFVLKTIYQLEIASVESVSQATQLSLHEVIDALRFLSMKKYIRRVSGNYEISLDWLRPITVMLVRKHLLQEGIG